MSKIHFCLQDTLDELGITANKLAVEAKIPPNSLYNMTNNKTSRVNTDTLISILDVLNIMAKEKGIMRDYNVSDVFIYINE